LGVGEFAEPEIFDLGDEDEDEEPEARRPRDAPDGHEAGSSEAAETAGPDVEASDPDEGDIVEKEAEPRLSEAALEDEDLHEIEDPATETKDVKQPGDED
jgi:hypothetical protein